jgi:hypothetical protein
VLAPDIVEAILDGRQSAAMTLAVLMRPFAVGWDRQDGDWILAGHVEAPPSAERERLQCEPLRSLGSTVGSGRNSQ